MPSPDMEACVTSYSAERGVSRLLGEYDLRTMALTELDAAFVRVNTQPPSDA